MSAALTVECAVHFQRRARGRKDLEAGPEPAPLNLPVGRVPRVARLMALAIKMDGLLRSGAVASYTELARLGRVTPARISQIMGLLQLAPDLQEAVLFLPRTERGRDRLQLRDLLAVAGELDWSRQRRRWAQLHALTPRVGPSPT